MCVCADYIIKCNIILHKYYKSDKCYIYIKRYFYVTNYYISRNSINYTNADDTNCLRCWKQTNQLKPYSKLITVAISLCLQNYNVCMELRLLVIILTKSKMDKVGVFVLLSVFGIYTRYIYYIQDKNWSVWGKMYNTKSLARPTNVDTV